jgi:excisionase family DNA binding protein
MIARSPIHSNFDDEDFEKFADIIAEKVAIKLSSRPKQRFVSRKELAAITGLGERTIDRWKSEGRLPFETAGRRVLFPVDSTLQAIAALKENRKIRPDSDPIDLQSS